MQFIVYQLYLTKAIKIIQADTEKIKIENISEARRQRQKRKCQKENEHLTVRNSNVMHC